MQLGYVARGAILPPLSPPSRSIARVALVLAISRVQGKRNCLTALCEIRGVNPFDTLNLKPVLQSVSFLIYEIRLELI